MPLLRFCFIGFCFRVLKSILLSLLLFVTFSFGLVSVSVSLIAAVTAVPLLFFVTFLPCTVFVSVTMQTYICLSFFQVEHATLPSHEK